MLLQGVFWKLKQSKSKTTVFKMSKYTKTRKNKLENSKLFFYNFVFALFFTIKVPCADFLQDIRKCSLDSNTIKRPTTNKAYKKIFFNPPVWANANFKTNSLVFLTSTCGDKKYLFKPS